MKPVMFILFSICDMLLASLYVSEPLPSKVDVSFPSLLSSCVSDAIFVIVSACVISSSFDCWSEFKPIAEWCGFYSECPDMSDSLVAEMLWLVRPLASGSAINPLLLSTNVS